MTVESCSTNFPSSTTSASSQPRKQRNLCLNFKTEFSQLHLLGNVLPLCLHIDMRAILELFSHKLLHCTTTTPFSRVRLFLTPCTAALQASCPSPTPGSLPKLLSIESVMPSNHLILCRPLLLPPSIFPSIRVFSNESALRIRWPKFWSFSFNINPSSEHPGLISFRMERFDLLAVQGTLKSLLQHHSSKASILRHSAFIIVQLSYPYMTTRITITLTRHRRNINNLR